MFILVATVGIGAQSLNAGSNQTQGQNQTNTTLFTADNRTQLQNQTNTTLFTADNQTFPTLGNETIQSTLSELIPENETNQSGISQQIQNVTEINQTSTQDFANSSLTSTIKKLRAELAKLPENASESEIIAFREKFLAFSPFGPAILDQTYRVTVTFDSISFHEDHDGAGLGPANCCSGEWTLAAFVQGKGTDLLWHRGGIDNGDTLNFPSGTAVTVDIPKGMPLSILTVGYEDDTGFWEQCTWHGIPGGCGFQVSTWSAANLSPKVTEILDGPVSSWLNSLHQFQVEWNEDVGCDYCVSDALGYINKLYDRPTYGQGAHVGVVSSNGDFTLRFTITVDPPSEEPEVEPGLDCDDELGVRVASSSPTQNPQFAPNNAIDNNLNTYWMSTLSLNPYITLDMNAQRVVCFIRIAWQDGDTHPYHFNVAVSKNGVTYTNVFSGVSSGTTKLPELYGLGENDARYVKITVTQSIQGSPNSMAKISQIDVLGRFTGNDPGQPTEGPVER